jgi:hypothetical protein
MLRQIFFGLTFVLLLISVLLVSCKNSKNKTITSDTTSKTVILTDSSRAELIRMLDTVVKSNSKKGDITIDARFISQGTKENGDSYITLKTKNDSLIVLNDPMPLKEGEIAKLKKEGNNITVTYNASDKKVKFIATEFEPIK